MESCTTLEEDITQKECEATWLDTLTLPAVWFGVCVIGILILRNSSKGAQNVTLLTGADQTSRNTSKASKKTKLVAVLWAQGCVAGLMASALENPLWSLLPFVSLCVLTTQKDGGNRLNGCILALVWTSTYVVAFAVLTLGSAVSVRIAAVAPFAVLVKLIGRADPSQHDLIGTCLVRLFWDTPLLLVMYICNAAGIRYLHDGHGRFISVLGDNVCCSSLPMSGDPMSSEWKDAKIRSVVNLCRETRGPTSSYLAEGIEQLYLPTTDMSAVSVENLVIAVEFILARRKSHPDSRTLVHCKGGRGRAATVCLAYEMATYPKGISKCEPSQLVEEMKKKRSVIEPVVATYPSIIEFQRLWATRPAGGDEAATG